MASSASWASLTDRSLIIRDLTVQGACHSWVLHRHCHLHVLATMGALSTLSAVEGWRAAMFLVLLSLRDSGGCVRYVPLPVSGMPTGHKVRQLRVGSSGLIIAGRLLYSCTCTARVQALWS